MDDSGVKRRDEIGQKIVDLTADFLFTFTISIDPRNDDEALFASWRWELFVNIVDAFFSKKRVQDSRVPGALEGNTSGVVPASGKASTYE